MLFVNEPVHKSRMSIHARLQIKTNYVNVKRALLPDSELFPELIREVDNISSSLWLMD